MHRLPFKQMLEVIVFRIEFLSNFVFITKDAFILSWSLSNEDILAVLFGGGEFVILIPFCSKYHVQSIFMLLF